MEHMREIQPWNLGVQRNRRLNLGNALESSFSINESRQLYLIHHPVDSDHFFFRQLILWSVSTEFTSRGSLRRLVLRVSSPRLRTWRHCHPRGTYGGCREQSLGTKKNASAQREWCNLLDRLTILFVLSRIWLGYTLPFVSRFTLIKAGTNLNLPRWSANKFSASFGN